MSKHQVKITLTDCDVEIIDKKALHHAIFGDNDSTEFQLVNEIENLPYMVAAML